MDDDIKISDEEPRKLTLEEMAGKLLRDAEALEKKIKPILAAGDQTVAQHTVQRLYIKLLMGIGAAYGVDSMLDYHNTTLKVAFSSLNFVKKKEVIQ